MYNAIYVYEVDFDPLTHQAYLGVYATAAILSMNV